MWISDVVILYTWVGDPMIIGSSYTRRVHVLKLELDQDELEGLVNELNNLIPAGVAGCCMSLKQALEQYMNLPQTKPMVKRSE